MKTNRMSRAGVLGLAVVATLAASWLLPPMVHQYRRLCPVRPDGVAEADAYANFARRYGVSCSVCHNSWPQLTDVGYKFRTSGYRMPDELGNDAKWTNWGDNMSLRTAETYSGTTAKGKTPANNGFSNSGLEMYPWEGAVGKYAATNTEVDFAAGNTAATKGTIGGVSMSTLNLDAAFPINADSWATVRAGLISAFQGYGAADRGVGNLSPTFKPTPAQLQVGANGKIAKTGFTYPGFGSTGEGVELAYNWKGTHVSAQVTNGYNSFNGSATQGEDNHLKDFSFYINQMILGENAIAAHFYTGKAGYNTDASIAANGISGAETASAPYSSAWVDNYWRAVVYGTIHLLPKDKLDVLLGGCDGSDQVYDLQSKDPSNRFHSMGWFATLQSVNEIKGQQLTSALSYGTNRASTATAGNRVSDVTLAFAVPVENNKFSVDFQTRRTQQVGARDSIGNTADVQWQFMY